MSLKAKIIKHTGLQVIGRIFATLIGIAGVTLLTRYLGAEGYGEYTTATAFLQFFGITADLGLSLTGLQMVGEADEKNERRLVANITGLRLISSLVIFAFVPLVALFTPYNGEIRSAIIVGILAYIAMALNQVGVIVFQKKLTMHLAAIAEIVGRGMLFGALLLVVALDGGVVGAVWAMVAANVLQFGLYLFLARYAIPVSLAFDFPVWKQILTRSWPIALSIVFNLLYLRGDVIVLSLTRSQTEVGLYGAAYKVVDVATVIPIMFMGLVLPPLTRAWKERNMERVHHYLQQAYDGVATIALPILMGGILLAEPIIDLIGGHEFSQGAPLLVTLMLALFCVFLGTVSGHAVVAVEKQRPMIWGYLASALISLPLYILLIPKFGAPAAAWITVLSEAIVLVATFAMVRRATGFRLRFGITGKVILATVFFSVSLLTLRDISPLLAAAVSSGTYLLAIYFLGVLPKELLLQLVKKSTTS